MTLGLVYAQAIEGLWQGEIDIDHVFKVMLTTSAHAPNQDLHDFKDDVTNEVAGTGYTAGGATLANPTLTYTAATNTWKLDGDDVVWPDATITARHAHLYDDDAILDTQKRLIALQDFESDLSSSAADFSIAWDADGVVEFEIASV
jgi:hypothetical protein